MNDLSLNMKTVATPLGEMTAVAANGKICLLEFSDKKNLAAELASLGKHFGTEISATTHEVLNNLESELRQYFDGTLTDFSVPIMPIGTDFQKKVWENLRQIPYGGTKTYSLQAANIGSPKSVRAVANANGQNKISILIPCHRVIGIKGTLTGYSGGIERKMQLLELEKATLL